MSYFIIGLHDYLMSLIYRLVYLLEIIFEIITGEEASLRNGFFSIRPRQSQFESMLISLFRTQKRRVPNGRCPGAETNGTQS